MIVFLNFFLMKKAFFLLGERIIGFWVSISVVKDILTDLLRHYR